MSELVLRVGARDYSGWTALRVSRAITQAVGAFALRLTERWPGQPTKWAIEPGADCELALDGETVITGYVDAVERSLDATRHEIDVTGRDKAMDIVDCTALLPGDRFADITGLSLLQVAQLLCDPFGVKVRDDVGAKRTPKTSQQTTETVWELLERGARQAAAMIMSDGRGGLVITRAGTAPAPAPLVEGHVLAVSFVRDDSQRFRKYTSIGQTVSYGNSQEYPIEAAVSQKATVEDSAVLRHRPLVIEAEELPPGVSMQDRVDWERNVRRGRSRRVTVSVHGWSAHGRLWRPNEVATLRLPALGLEGEMLIIAVENVLDAQGTRTELTLAPREAYDLLPEGDRKGGGIHLSPEMERLLK